MLSSFHLLNFALFFCAGLFLEQFLFLSLSQGHAGDRRKIERSVFLSEFVDRGMSDPALVRRQTLCTATLVFVAVGGAL